MILTFTPDWQLMWYFLISQMYAYKDDPGTNVEDPPDIASCVFASQDNLGSTFQDPPDIGSHVYATGNVPKQSCDYLSGISGHRFSCCLLDVPWQSWDYLLGLSGYRSSCMPGYEATSRHRFSCTPFRCPRTILGLPFRILRTLLLMFIP